MIKPIIGIVTREEKINNKVVNYITKNNTKYLDNKCSYLGIISYDNTVDKRILSLCDGIIIPGGSDIYPYHFDIVDYCIKNKKPLLGICMGHQIIGLYANKQKEKDLIAIDNHHGIDKKHKININQNTILYNLYGNCMDTNSRHLYKLEKIDSPFKISASTLDNVIEGIEYVDDNNFIIGVQFHPEDMDNMNKLYDMFIDKSKNRKIN